MFDGYLIFLALGHFADIVKQIVVLFVKNKVTIKTNVLILEMAMIGFTVFNFMQFLRPVQHKLFTDRCKDFLDLPEEEIVKTDFSFSFLIQSNMHSEVADLSNGNYMSIWNSIALLTLFYTINFFRFLIKTEGLGNVLFMANLMISTVAYFLWVFIPLVITYVFTSIYLGSEIQKKKDFKGDDIVSLLLTAIDLMLNNFDFAIYNYPFGKAFNTPFAIIFKYIFFTTLMALIIAKYMTLFNKLPALKRMEIIELKNSNSFDNIYGSIAVSFFPLSILALPFVGLLLVLKSHRMNNFLLQI